MARIPVVTRDQISEKKKHHERLQHVEPLPFSTCRAPRAPLPAIA
jgi:hypothetical protein